MDNTDIRICFFGDSYVNGVCDPEYLGWAGRLVKAANARGYAITHYNLGVRKNTSGDVAKRWQEEAALRLVNDTQNYLVFSFGVNDTANGEASIDSVRQIIRLTKNTKCLFISAPAVADTEHNKRISRFNTQVSDLGQPFIDIFTALETDDKWYAEILQNDGFHPKEYGYSRIAEIIQQSQYWWFK